MSHSLLIPTTDSRVSETKLFTVFLRSFAHSVVEGPIQAVVTASALQMHKRCAVIVDEAAAGKLQFKDYYRWVFANEPEWAPSRG